VAHQVNRDAQMGPWVRLLRTWYQLRALNSPAVDRTQIDLVLIAHKKCVRTTVYYNIFGRKPTLRRLRAEDCDYESLIRIAIDFLTAHLQAWR